MAGLLKLAERKAYVWRLEHDLEFLESPMTEQGKLLNVDRTTIAAWRDELGEEKYAELATKNFARQFPVVASALLKRIKKTGDPAAIELYLARFQGWVKKAALEVSRGQDAEAREASTEKIAETILRALPAETRRAVIEAAEQPSAPEALDMTPSGDLVQPWPPVENEGKTRISSENIEPSVSVSPSENGGKTHGM